MTDAPVHRKIRRHGFRRLLGGACAAALLTAGAAVVAPGTAQAAITTNQTGIHGGYFYAFWTDTPGVIAMHPGPAGNYRLNWNNTGNAFAGKGWNPGGRRTITYSAQFNPVGTAWMGLYGWTKNPLTEYYIVDNWSTWRPPGTIGFRGTVVSDGGVYDVYRTQRTVGINPYFTYWSVRQTKRTGGGTITVGNHFDAWASLGMPLNGTHDYQIVGVETYQSSGEANVTVWGPPPYPSTPPTTAPAAAAAR